MNGFIAALMDRLGYGWIVAKFLIATVAAVLILLNSSGWPFWILNAAYAAAVINNWRVSR